MWRAVWRYKSREYGFTDLDGRVLPWAKRYQIAADVTM